MLLLLQLHDEIAKPMMGMEMENVKLNTRVQVELE
jgi:hypothetical protein